MCEDDYGIKSARLNAALLLLLAGFKNSWVVFILEVDDSVDVEVLDAFNISSKSDLLKLFSLESIF